MAGYRPDTQLPLAALGAVARARRRFIGTADLDAAQLALLAAFDALPAGLQSLLERQAAQGKVDYITGRDVDGVKDVKTSHGMLSSQFADNGELGDTTKD